MRALHRGAAASCETIAPPSPKPSAATTTRSSSAAPRSSGAASSPLKVNIAGRAKSDTLFTAAAHKEWSDRQMNPMPGTCGDCKMPGTMRLRKLEIEGCYHQVLCDDCYEKMQRLPPPTGLLARVSRTDMCPYCGGREPKPEADAEPTAEPGGSSAEDESYASTQESA